MGGPPWPWLGRLVYFYGSNWEMSFCFNCTPNIFDDFSFLRFGSSPLSIAIQMDIHLDEALLTRLASPKAAAVRRYDGKTCLHLAASSWGMTGWKAGH